MRRLTPQRFVAISSAVTVVITMLVILLSLLTLFFYAARELYSYYLPYSSWFTTALFVWAVFCLILWILDAVFEWDIEL